ncbi:MAG: hypothetical protein ABJZ55_13740 [Fuerstiella sp.]
MERTAEYPDAHVANLAEQFLDTAGLLLRNIPGVVAPSSLRVNAAFAIELFLKSLNSHWQHHELEELGDGAYEITTQSNVRGHHLDRLYDDLPDRVRSDLNGAFASNRLASTFDDLCDALSTYAKTFENERYGFERRSIATDNRPMAEIVELGEFFREFIKNTSRVRYALS